MSVRVQVRGVGGGTQNFPYATSIREVGSYLLVGGEDWRSAVAAFHNDSVTYAIVEDTPITHPSGEPAVFHKAEDGSAVVLPPTETASVAAEPSTVGSPEESPSENPPISEGSSSSVATGASDAAVVSPEPTATESQTSAVPAESSAQASTSEAVDPTQGTSESPEPNSELPTPDPSPVLTSDELLNNAKEALAALANAPAGTDLTQLQAHAKAAVEAAQVALHPTAPVSTTSEPAVVQPAS